MLCITLDEEGGEKRMAVQDTDDVRIALRIPRWLHEDIETCAVKSGWDLSKQIRYELASLRGKASIPFLPQPPSHDHPRRMKRA
jgi:hypothetical protein